MGRNLADAALGEAHDPDLKALGEAKRSRNQKEMGRLIPILRERYGADDLSRIFKAM